MVRRELLEMSYSQNMYENRSQLNRIFEKMPDNGTRADLTTEEINALSTALDKVRNNAVWFNPLESTFNEANNPKSTVPDYGPVVAKLENLSNSTKELQLAKALGYKLDSTEIDRATIAPYTKPYQNNAVLFWDGVRKVRKGEMKASALITQQGYTVIANTQIAYGSMLNLTNYDFILDQLATPFRTDWVKTHFPQIFSFRAAEDIGENDVSSPQSVDYTLTPFTLKKAQAHVQASRWASMMPRYFDPVSDSFGLIESDFPRIINTDLATTLGTFPSDASLGAWDVIGGGAFHHTNKPQRDILDQETTIDSAGGQADTIVVNPLTAQVMNENTWLRLSGVLSGIPAQTGVNPKLMGHSLLPRYTIGVERATLIANQLAFVYDRRGLLKFIGPRRSATYDKTPENVEAQIVDVWYGSAVRASALGIKITGVTS